MSPDFGIYLEATEEWHNYHGTNLMRDFGMVKKGDEDSLGPFYVRK